MKNFIVCNGFDRKYCNQLNDSGPDQKSAVVGLLTYACTKKYELSQFAGQSHSIVFSPEFNDMISSEMKNQSTKQIEIEQRY